MTNQEILVSIKHAFGNKLIYPECDTGKKFASIAETKTLSPHVIVLIKSLGYQVKVKGGLL
jgi:hypothetical protein